MTVNLLKTAKFNIGRRSVARVRKIKIVASENNFIKYTNVRISFILELTPTDYCTMHRENFTLFF